MKPKNRTAEFSGRRYPRQTSSKRREQAVEIAKLDVAFADALMKCDGFTLGSMTPLEYMPLYEGAYDALMEAGVPMSQWN